MNQNYNDVLNRPYKVLFVDVDTKDEEVLYSNLRFIANILYHNGLENNNFKIYETGKGYHFKVFFETGMVSGHYLLHCLLRLHADHMFINRFLRTGTQTLFNVRRGKPNVSDVTEKYKEYILKTKKYIYEQHSV